MLLKHFDLWPHYASRNASTRFIRAARMAGRMPPNGACGALDSYLEYT